MKSNDETVILVFNGEIYNYKHLYAELISKGFVFRGDSDTEVLLNLYLYEGESMLQRLEGIFSFAIWDSQKNRLFIARDALGVKPLYYRSNDNYFAFASELKALIKLVPEESELDFLSLHRYLSFLWCPGVGTPLKSFFKLQPGEAIFVNEGCIQKRWIWYQLPVFWKNTKKFNKTHTISETAEHLRRSVHQQMVSDVPLGGEQIDEDVLQFQIWYGFY
jgi:asparagine synthase (glutamine-hydrolysing)